jgi:hypothetical protein
MTGTATQNAIGRCRGVIHHMGVYEATLARLEQDQDNAWCSPLPPHPAALQPPQPTDPRELLEVSKDAKHLGAPRQTFHFNGTFMRQ